MAKPDSRPKVAAFDENLFVTWNIGTPGDSPIANGNEDSVGVFTVKSADGGKTFSKPYKLNENNQPVEETQVASTRNNM